MKLHFIRVRNCFGLGDKLAYVAMGLFFFAVVCTFEFRQALMGGFDGILHLTAVEAQIEAFRHWEGATPVSSMGRYVGYGVTLHGYQLFYWVVGSFGAILPLNAFQALLLFLS